MNITEVTQSHAIYCENQSEWERIDKLFDKYTNRFPFGGKWKEGWEYIVLKSSQGLRAMEEWEIDEDYTIIDSTEITAPMESNTWKLESPDGTKIELSQESAERIRNEYGKEDEVRSWEDCMRKLKKWFWIDSTSSVMRLDEAAGIDATDKGVLPTEQDAKQVLAEMQLRVIANVLNDGWEPDWDNDTEFKYVVRYDYDDDDFIVFSATVISSSPIYFKDEKTAQKAIQIGKEQWLIYFGVK